MHVHTYVILTSQVTAMLILCVYRKVATGRRSTNESHGDIWSFSTGFSSCLNHGRISSMRASFKGYYHERYYSFRHYNHANVTSVVNAIYN